MGEGIVHCYGCGNCPYCRGELPMVTYEEPAEYQLQFVKRLQKALGYVDSDEIVEDQDFGGLTVMCNHAANRIERLTHVNQRLEIKNDHLYKDLVFRFIDRMNDPCEDTDPAEQILREFVAAFQVIWDDEEKSMTQKNDDGGVEGLSEGERVDRLLELAEADDRYCSECGQEWTGTL